MQNFHILRNPGFQFDKVLPIENGSLVTFVNNYLYSMIGMLNDFCNNVETRLIELNKKIDNCHSNLVILEMKLNSFIMVPLNENSISSSEKCSNDKSSTNTNIDENNSVDNMKKSQTILTENKEPKTSNEEDNNYDVANNQISESTEPNVVPSDQNDNEQLQIYRKMLKFGVHENAVRQKMLIDGIDPSLLNI